MVFASAIGAQARSFPLTCGAILLLCTWPAHAVSITLAWDPNTEPVLGGYLLSWGQASRNYTVHVDVGSATRHTLTGLRDGTTYYFAVRAYDTRKTVWSDYSNEVCKAIGTSSVGDDLGQSRGLVAAYDFEEGGGPRVIDASEQHNHGIIGGAHRTRHGRFGKALLFNGIGDWVTIKDAASLDLSVGMTLEAWVYPTDFMSGRQTILFKEAPPEAASYRLDANSDTDRPAVGVFIDSPRSLQGGSWLMPDNWVHLAGTFDGSALRLYLNGDPVAEAEQSGSMKGSDGAFRIGGDSVWGEFFRGRIDEVRVYNRALSHAEIRADMEMPIATSSPPRLLLGFSKKGPIIGSVRAGQAQAFQTKAIKNGWVTRLSVYVQKRSSATKLVVGVYSNKNGHPGALLAHGILSTSGPKSWRHIPVRPLFVKAGRKYWIGILSRGGILKIRKRRFSAGRLCEASVQRSLTTLPSRWKTGLTCPEGLPPAYGAGHQ